MRLQDHHRDQARRIAQHEMGHYVIARAMGFNTSEVTLELNGFDGHKGGAGIQLAGPVSTIEAAQNFLARRVIVLFAGAMSETLTPDHIPQTGIDNDKAIAIIRGGRGAEQDHAKAREAITLLRNMRYPMSVGIDDIKSELEAIDLELWLRAQELVEHFEGTIVGIARTLAEKVQALDKTEQLTEEFLESLPAIQAIEIHEITQ
jgi:hypothetical protein